NAARCIGAEYCCTKNLCAATCGALLHFLRRIYAAILLSLPILRGKIVVAALFFTPPPLPLQSADDRKTPVVCNALNMVRIGQPTTNSASAGKPLTESVPARCRPLAGG